MATKYIDSITYGGNEYKFIDDSSGYTKNTGTITDVKVDGSSVVSSGVASLVTSTSHPYNASTNALATLEDISAAGGANDGALKLKKNSGTASSIFTANQAGDSTITFTTTSVGSASGWSAGSVPTLGTEIPADDITAWTTNTPTTIDTTKFSGGSFTQGTDTFVKPTHASDSFTPASLASGFYSAGIAASFSQGSDTFTKPTHGSDSFTPASLTSNLGSNSATASNPTTLTLSFSGGSYTQGTFTQGSFSQGTDSFTANTPTAIDTSKFSGGSFTQGAFTQGSFTQGSDSFTSASLASGFYSAGSAASLSYTAKSIPNVTNVGSAPSLTVTSTTVVNDISAS